MEHPGRGRGGHGNGAGIHHAHDHQHDHTHEHAHGGGNGDFSGGQGYGSAGTCICIRCNIEIPHRAGIPCPQEKCPQCGKPMARKEMLEERQKQRASDKQPALESGETDKA